MDLPPPKSAARLAGPGRDDPADVLKYEILREQAHSLALLGRELTAVLEALREAAPGDAAYEALLDQAAETAWKFMVQRELCGFRDWEDVIALYRIPAAVLNRMGAFKKDGN